MRILTVPALGLALALGLVLGSGAMADAGDPRDMVRETTREVLTALDENRERIEGDPRAVYELVGDIVLPRFDFELMSRFVLARNWRTASEAQREQFTEAFRQLLVRTYARALAEYSGEEEVRIPSQRIDTSRDRVTVKTEIVQPGGPPIPVDYTLLRQEDDWRVFDVTIEGVSLVQNYRSQFDGVVRREGMDALIEQLASRNREVGEGG
ncbi:MlaC/ttg2D family ABC transporter substrate-binding protein [Spiribacter halobius]|uniref:Toluene tolerance protein n=1 Tax=Sediminicurvatus halobius TaxID=2182432 RepID=A0A2U2N7Z3_9GAMM|nr:ABC transporter substrate-binding protein [Spiribacter halobius]PWG65197.1 toluene tolerance protein [Spiribacter halobius]UEX78849.1 ABC transporter substrate-binding protein [Spiribacter halobius]